MKSLPVILVEVYISVSFSKPIYPQHFILGLDFLGINALFSQWDLVLLIVVDGSHLLHEAQEYGNSIAREMFARVPIISLEN